MAVILHTRLDRKILLPVFGLLIIGFGAFSLLLWRQDQVETVRAAAESSHDHAAMITKSVLIFMQHGRPDIARQFIEECRTRPKIEAIEIYRPDGTPAFRGADTLQAVTAYRQRQGFEALSVVLRQSPGASQEDMQPAPPPMTHPEFWTTVHTGQAVSFRETQAGRERYTHFRPLLYRNDAQCQHCHEGDAHLGGVAMVSTSLAPLHQATVRRTLRFGGMFFVMTLFVIVCLSVFLRQAILQLIDRIAAQVRRIARGDLSQQVTVVTRDEIGELAADVNRMTHNLVVYQEQLIRSEKLFALGTLAAGFAHEINNPLASIAGYTEDLLDTVHTSPSVNGSDPHEKLRQGLTVILKQADRCQEITRRVLNFARTEAFHPEYLALGLLLEEVVALLEPQARQHEVRLRCHLAANLPLIKSDSASLQQAFFNIVKNGIEAITDGGEVRVAARCAGSHVEVTVTDTGSGIPAEWERKIFDPFFTTKPPGQGTGLGLPISCLLIEGLGGTLRFRSRAGHGTIFTILLPVHQEGGHA